MKIFLSKIRLIILLTIFTFSNAHADWVQDLSNNLSSTASAPSVYNAQGGMYFSGGGYSFSAPSSTIKLVNARAPSINAGCAGINIDFGGFQFINGEQLLTFAKQVIGAAPGYAFNLAMQTLCPQCTDIMNTLTDTANMLNGLDLDSCKSAQMLVDGAFDAIGSTALGQNVKKEASKFNDGVKTVSEDIATLNKKFKEMVGNKCKDTKKCPKEFLEGEATFLQMVFHKNTELKQLANLTGITTPQEMKSDLINIVRAFVGDIKINMKNDEGDEVEPKIQIMPAWRGANNKNLIQDSINYWITGDRAITPESLTYAYLKNGVKQTVNIDITEGTKANATSFAYISYNNLKTIHDAFIKRRALTDKELQFLAMFKSPVYKVLNTSSIDNNALESFIQNFTVLAASQYAYEMISRITREVASQLVVLESEINDFDIVDKDDRYKTGISIMKDNMRVLNEYTYSIYEKAYTVFDKNMKNVDMVKDMTDRMQALFARHPVMGKGFFAQGATK